MKSLADDELNLYCNQLINDMPYTRKQVRYLLSGGSPLDESQKDKMVAELHSDPAMGHKRKGSAALKRKRKRK